MKRIDWFLTFPAICGYPETPPNSLFFPGKPYGKTRNPDCSRYKGLAWKSAQRESRHPEESADWIPRDLTEICRWASGKKAHPIVLLGKFFEIPGSHPH